MILTGKQVESDLYAMLKRSLLASKLTGKVYLSGMRPRDSVLEDAVITFIAGTDGDIPRGVFTIKIFFPDVDPYDNGVLVEDEERAFQLSKAAKEWVDMMTEEMSNYSFKLMESIRTEEVEEVNQHFVLMRIQYRYFAEERETLLFNDDAALVVTPMQVSESGDQYVVKVNNQSNEKTI